MDHMHHPADSSAFQFPSTRKGLFIFQTLSQLLESSTASFVSFTAYAAAFPPPGSLVIMSVASCRRISTRRPNDVRRVWMSGGERCGCRGGISCKTGKSCTCVVLLFLFFFLLSCLTVLYSFFFRVTRLIKASNSKKTGQEKSESRCSSTTSDSRLRLRFSSP